MPAAKCILNLSEAQTHESLRKIAEAWSAHVFPKVRVADVLSIEQSGVEDELYSFALKSHFDFVVTDQEFRPVFAVEFDGVGHLEPRQIARDQQKDALCEHFEFPVLRINANYLPRRFERIDLLTWFATTWFCEREHARLQRRGQISYDDAFDPRFVVTSPGHANEYPLWISRKVQGRLRKAFFDGKLIDFCHSVIVVKDEQNVLRSLAWVLINEGVGVVSRTAFRPNLFSTGLVEAAEQIAVYGLGEAVQDVLNGAALPTATKEIEAEINRYATDGSLLFAIGGGKLPLPSFRRAGG